MRWLNVLINAPQFLTLKLKIVFAFENPKQENFKI